MGALALGNDVAASIRVPAGLTAAVFEDAAFGGARLDLTADMPELSIGVSSVLVAPARRAR